jgi:hypothetical protein
MEPRTRIEKEDDFRFYFITFLLSLHLFFQFDLDAQLFTLKSIPCSKPCFMHLQLGYLEVTVQEKLRSGWPGPFLKVKGCCG